MSTVSLLRKIDEPEHTPEPARGDGFDLPRLERAVREMGADASRELIVEQRLARPPEEVFAFFSDPANLEQITPAFLRFRVLGTTTSQIGNGTLINYALRLHGIPLRWQSRIESWAPPRVFVDTQTRGPYALWHHTHEFEADDGGTIIRDRVRYRLPLGALGNWIGGGLVRLDLAAIFDFRRQRIQELLG